MKFAFAVLALTLPLLTGCGTVAARTNWDNQTYALTSFYPATSVDDQMVSGVFDAPDYDIGAKSMGLFFCSIVDFPFSVTTDTLCLPYDIWAYNRGGGAN